MYLTPELKVLGRQNFLEAVADSPSYAKLSTLAQVKGPKASGKAGAPVKAALIGAGIEGKVLLNACKGKQGWIDLRAVCDINPGHATGAADGLVEQGWARPHLYQDFKEMLAKEDLEAVIIATPLFTHADIVVACLGAGKHVLCEKMMAWDVPGCHRMREAAQRSGKLLEIGYQRFYSANYQGAYESIIKKQLLGDIFYARAVWHRNKTWRRAEAPPSPDYDPRPWGYDSFDHLINWRLFRKYSRGLMAELGSHQISIANWFLGAVPSAVYSTGGVFRWKDAREVPDHVYTTFDYPDGRTATFTSIESNSFDDSYEQFEGTKGTVILTGKGGAYYFKEGEALGAATAINLGAQVAAGAGEAPDTRLVAYENEIISFCDSVRSGAPLRCGPEKAQGSAAACIRAEEACVEKARLTLA
jgi:predicted dehydrogenase